MDNPLASYLKNLDMLDLNKNEMEEILLVIGFSLELSNLAKVSSQAEIFYSNYLSESLIKVRLSESEQQYVVNELYRLFEKSSKYQVPGLIMAISRAKPHLVNRIAIKIFDNFYKELHAESLGQLITILHNSLNRDENWMPCSNTVNQIKNSNILSQLAELSNHTDEEISRISNDTLNAIKAYIR